MSSREVYLCVAILFVAMINWSYLFTSLERVLFQGQPPPGSRVEMPGHFYGDEGGPFPGAETHCNPKFPKTCVE